jgi:hypothetical protein
VLVQKSCNSRFRDDGTCALGSAITIENLNSCGELHAHFRLRVLEEGESVTDVPHLNHRHYPLKAYEDPEAQSAYIRTKLENMATALAVGVGVAGLAFFVRLPPMSATPSIF